MPWRSPRAFWTRFVLYGIAAGSLAILGGLNLTVQRAAPAGEPLNSKVLERSEQAIRDQLTQQIDAYRDRGQFEPQLEDLYPELGRSEARLRVIVWTASLGQPRQLLNGKLFPPDVQQQVIVSGSLVPSNVRSRVDSRHHLGTVFVDTEGNLAALLCASNRPLPPDALQLTSDNREINCPIGSQRLRY